MQLASWTMKSCQLHRDVSPALHTLMAALTPHSAAQWREEVRWKLVSGELVG